MAAAVETIRFDRLAEWAERTGRELASIDFRPALKRCAVVLAAATKSNFFGGHAPDGSPWAALKHPRANSKGGDKPLRDKGLLMASVTGGGQSIQALTPTSMEYGTNLFYAGFHQLGTVHIPQREFLGWTPALVDECEMILLEHAERVAGGESGGR